jgi:3-methyladenine DNA glycosylase AlkC
MVEIRSPRKGKGVPKETLKENIISDLGASMTSLFPEVDWDRLGPFLEPRGFFAAGMQEQVRIMAAACVELAGAPDNPGHVLEALASSPVEKVRGVAAFTIPIIYPSDLQEQLEALFFTGQLDGTWPQELSATVLHNLIILHGVGEILPLVQDWIYDPNPAARRLVTESFRPRAVMLAHIDELKQDPSSLKQILEPLLDDPSDYVRKSVANNINDISKDNPQILLDWAREWASDEITPERSWILSRGLRTLVNSGDQEALDMLGFTPASNLTVKWLGTVPDEVVINQLLEFYFEIHNPTSQNAHVILILVIDGPGKGAKPRTSKYHLWRGDIPPGNSKLVHKKIHFTDKTTQAKLPGTYHLHLMLNGIKVENESFRFQLTNYS